MDALRRLDERGLVEVERDYVPLPRALAGRAGRLPRGGFSTEPVDGRGRNPHRPRTLSPSSGNRDELAKLIAANARDERRELMWGSPGTMLVARELGFDELWEESAAWLRSRRDEDGVWEQDLYGQKRRILGPAHGWAGCVLALEDGQGSPRRRGGSRSRRRARQLATARGRRSRVQPRWLDTDAVVPRRTWDRRVPRQLSRRRTRARRRGADLASGAIGQRRESLSWNGREWVRVPRTLRSNRRRAMARPGPSVRDARPRSGGARPVDASARPVHALDRGSWDGSVSRRLRRRARGSLPIP